MRRPCKGHGRWLVIWSSQIQWVPFRIMALIMSVKCYHRGQTIVSFHQYLNYCYRIGVTVYSIQSAIKWSQFQLSDPMLEQACQSCTFLMYIDRTGCSLCTSGHNSRQIAWTGASRVGSAWEVPVCMTRQPIWPWVHEHPVLYLLWYNP